jgi:AraC family transcriptional regulator, regulatory protein of adaptative response / methylated-DNA-[protein]-cysteine methyltransferase
MALRQTIGGMTSTHLWQAVEARDARADGTFVYAVESTGIYCRPSCPSRRPRRSHVAYFPAPADAERAGFRACRRCRPTEPPAADPRAERVRRACALIADHDGERLTLEALAASVGGNPQHLQRTFVEILGISPREYADACRLARLKGALRSEGRVTDAVYEAGFGSSSRVYERAAGALGMTPGAYRRGGEGMAVRYATAPCSLGRVLVAATERGVSAVKLGASDAALVADLKREFPAASVAPADSALGQWLGAIVDYLEAGGPPSRPNSPAASARQAGGRTLDLPLDVRATAFQWKVWRALRRIPPGHTASYAEIAKRIGQPSAARAVARACATNPVCLVIPCHRVVATGGGLGGYRWGVARKKALLEAERHVD